MVKPPLVIGSAEVSPGSRKTIELTLPRLYTHDAMSMSVIVVNGRRPGPNLFLSAAVHGDELNGIEIVRRVLEKTDSQHLRGALIAVPIVNVFGLITHSRYLPDRRDLNRSFPGSKTGSLAARIAATFMENVVKNATHGIDLHTAATGRTNLPQIRGNLYDEETLRLAEEFGAPVMIHASVRDGSLRGAAAKRGLPVLVYEAGEPDRFNADAIALGVTGVLRVMKCLRMLRKARSPAKHAIQRVYRSSWIRARQSGFIHISVGLGDRVEKGQTLGVIQNALGENAAPLRCRVNAIVIGHVSTPLVHRGDAVVHIAEIAPTAE